MMLYSVPNLRKRTIYPLRLPSEKLEMRGPATRSQSGGTILHFAKQQIRDHQPQIYQRTDRMFVKLMILQWFAGIAIAVWTSPKTWVGSENQAHPFVSQALFLGGLIIFLPVLLGSLLPGATATRYIMTLGQMLMGSLLIHL